MKQILTIITLLFLNVPTFADTLGIVNMETILTSAKLVKDFQTNIKDKQESYDKLLEKHQKRINKAKSTNKSEEEMEELITEIEELLLPKRQELAQLEMGFQQNLILSIQRVSKEVAKEIGVDVVVDNRVVFFGGIDMTDLVLDRLNQ
jgi:Skp family chaperone for outer membrane proteins